MADCIVPVAKDDLLLIPGLPEDLPGDREVRIRKGATRSYDVGTVFRERDGLFVVHGKTAQVSPSGVRYDYELWRMDSDIAAVWDVMTS